MKIAINAINSNTSLGGVDRYVIQLLSHLSAIDNLNTYYVFYANWQTYIRVLNSPKINLIELKPPRNKFLRAFWQIFCFPYFLSKFNPDILHYSNPIPFIWKICPVIVTVHDMAEFSSTFKYGQINSHLKRLIAKLSIRLSDKIITVSNYSKQQIHKRAKVIPKKISVVLEGVSHHAFKVKDCSKIIKKYSLPAKYILFVGAIKEGKNIETILYAFNDFDQTFQDLALVIVGRKGNAYEKIVNLIEELSLECKVLILGHVPDEDLACLYRNAKVFVFPSLIEGFGLPVLEAMASGVPVVASDTTSLPEVCGNAAMLVNPTDRNEIRIALERILNDRSLGNFLIQKGYQRAKALSWDTVAKATLHEYMN